jgi:hypothetical protein
MTGPWHTANKPTTHLVVERHDGHSVHCDARIALEVLEEVVEVLVDRYRDEGVPLAQICTAVAVSARKRERERDGTTQVSDRTSGKLLKRPVQVRQRGAGVDRGRADRDEVPKPTTTSSSCGG